MMNETSIVEYFSGNEGYRCGYCKSENTSYSHGLWAHTLTPLDYQNLIDRGWRRSGKYCYKPTMHRTCCPQYTIRCEVNKLVLSRSQKKVIKRVNNFLCRGLKEKSSSDQFEKEHSMDVSEVPQAVDVQMLKDVKNCTELKESDLNIIKSEILTESVPSTQDISASTSVQSNANSSQSNDSYVGDPIIKFITLPVRGKKAKDLRKERKLQKLLKKGMPEDEARNSLIKRDKEPKSIEKFLFDVFDSANPIFQLKLRLVPNDFNCDEFMSSFDESFNVFKKYQMMIHNDGEETCTEQAFEDFLMETPFKRLDGVATSEISIYGSFHQQYWLNNKLIAVGVIDILPKCISSVYFYYDPDYSFLSLGTYAALREIAFTRELSQSYPQLQYYYMGFYIHECVKMRYKGQFRPSYLLCPETYNFIPIELCTGELDVAKYQRLEDDPNKEDIDGKVNLQEVLVLFNNKKATYPSYKKLNKNANDEDIVKEYANFVGKKCYRKMLLFRSP